MGEDREMMEMLSLVDALDMADGVKLDMVMIKGLNTVDSCNRHTASQICCCYCCSSC